MTQIDKIKAKIEREMKWKPKVIPSGMRQRDVLNIRKTILLTLKDFINSLPAEQPSEDFKEEFNNFCIHGDIRNPNFEGPFGYNDIRKTAIHFAQWQKEQDTNKACEWLKENIYNRVYKCNDGLGFPTAAFLEEFKKAMEDK